MNCYAVLLILFYCSCILSTSSSKSLTLISSLLLISSSNITSSTTSNNNTSTTIPTSTLSSTTTAIFNMSYRAVLRKLYQINSMNPVKMGLSNTLALYNLIGRPLDTIPIVHVAGTNGKGSVALKTANCLQQSGIKTG